MSKTESGVRTVGRFGSYKDKITHARIRNKVKNSGMKKLIDLIYNKFDSIDPRDKEEQLKFIVNLEKQLEYINNSDRKLQFSESWIQYIIEDLMKKSESRD